MRSPLTAASLAAFLATTPLVGCGTGPISQPVGKPSELRRAPAIAAARRFWSEKHPAVSRHVLQTQDGYRVLLAWEDQILWLPATESLEKPASEEIATTLLVVAADMLVAGARAWLVYALTHRGDAFDRDACAQAIITAMVAEALAAVPIVGRVLSSLLLPVVLAWIARSGKWPWQVDTKALLTSGADLHRHFVRALARSLTIMGNPS